MANQKKNQSDGVNPFRWMTTYTDLVTLLLTFFVLLISMSVISEQKRMEAMSSVMGAFGAREGGQSLIGSPKAKNITVSSAPIKEEDLAIENLRRVQMKNSLQADMNVLREEERIIISLNDRLLFKPRSSKIENQRIGFLSDLREVFKTTPSRIELRGYADPSETVFEPNRLSPAMTLSTKRAFAVLGFLAEGGEIPPDSIVAHGFGHTPAVPGSQKDAHQQNRQVQIILDFREKLPYRLSKPGSNPFLDFKGFLFKLQGEESGK